MKRIIIALLVLAIPQSVLSQRSGGGNFKKFKIEGVGDEEPEF